MVMGFRGDPEKMGYPHGGDGGRGIVGKCILTRCGIMDPEGVGRNPRPDLKGIAT